MENSEASNNPFCPIDSEYQSDNPDHQPHTKSSEHPNALHQNQDKKCHIHTTRRSTSSNADVEDAHVMCSAHIIHLWSATQFPQIGRSISHVAQLLHRNITSFQDRPLRYVIRLYFHFSVSLNESYFFFVPFPVVFCSLCTFVVIYIILIWIYCYWQ